MRVRVYGGAGNEGERAEGGGGEGGTHDNAAYVLKM